MLRKSLFSIHTYTQTHTHTYTHTLHTHITNLILFRQYTPEGPHKCTMAHVVLTHTHTHTHTNTVTNTLTHTHTQHTVFSTCPGGRYSCLQGQLFWRHEFTEPLHTV